MQQKEKRRDSLKFSLCPKRAATTLRPIARNDCLLETSGTARGRGIESWAKNQPEASYKVTRVAIKDSFKL